MQPRGPLSRRIRFVVLFGAVLSGRLYEAGKGWRYVVVYLLLRLVYGLWFLGAFALLLLTLADTIFGRAPFAQRLRALPLRCVLALFWPFAAITRRGREILWSQWRNVL